MTNCRWIRFWKIYVHGCHQVIKKIKSELVVPLWKRRSFEVTKHHLTAKAGQRRRWSAWGLLLFWQMDLCRFPREPFIRISSMLFENRHNSFGCKGIYLCHPQMSSACLVQITLMTFSYIFPILVISQLPHLHETLYPNSPKNPKDHLSKVPKFSKKPPKSIRGSNSSPAA